MNAALAPMKHYTGECVGGPHAGKKLTHWLSIAKMYKKAIDPVIETGEYRFQSGGRWRWFPKKQR